MKIAIACATVELVAALLVGLLEPVAVRRGDVARVGRGSSVLAQDPASGAGGNSWNCGASPPM